MVDEGARLKSQLQAFKSVISFQGIDDIHKPPAASLDVNAMYNHSYESITRFQGIKDDNLWNEITGRFPRGFISGDLEWGYIFLQYHLKQTSSGLVSCKAFDILFQGCSALIDLS